MVRWADAMEEVWDVTLEADLVTLLEGQDGDEGTLEARGLIAILNAATANDHVRLLAPARLAASRITDDWSTDAIEKPMLRDALKALERRIPDAKRKGSGQLSLSAERGADGGLSLSTASQEGDLEVVLDLSDEEPASGEVAEAEAEEPAAW